SQNEQWNREREQRYFKTSESFLPASFCCWIGVGKGVLHREHRTAPRRIILRAIVAFNCVHQSRFFLTRKRHLWLLSRGWLEFSGKTRGSIA
ncbi:MAG: hypothetical protein M3X11_17730, partial [Acidobacteriota bacterium]|nr:hypothetical protein [Acidobacteriota bacterium]